MWGFCLQILEGRFMSLMSDFPSEDHSLDIQLSVFLKVCLKLTEQKNAGILLPQVLVRRVSCQDLWAEQSHRLHSWC